MLESGSKVTMISAEWLEHRRFRSAACQVTDADQAWERHLDLGWIIKLNARRSGTPAHSASSITRSYRSTDLRRFVRFSPQGTIFKGIAGIGVLTMAFWITFVVLDRETDQGPHKA
jgi:hypothetical protein